MSFHDRGRAPLVSRVVSVAGLGFALAASMFVPAALADGDTCVRLSATVDGMPTEAAWYGGAEFYECTSGYQVLPLSERGTFATAVGAGVVEPVAWEVMWYGTYADLQQAVAAAGQVAAEQAAAVAEQAAIQPTDAESVEQQPADVEAQPQVEEVVPDETAAYAVEGISDGGSTYDVVG